MKIETAQIASQLLEELQKVKNDKENMFDHFRLLINDFKIPINDEIMKNISIGTSFYFDKLIMKIESQIYSLND